MASPHEGLVRPPWHPARRLRIAGVCYLVLLALVAVTAFDARAKRSRRDAEMPIAHAAARIVGPELALHAAARWLRHPTRSEPWAAATDAPGMLDLDPAGATAPPPREVLGAGLPRAERFVAPIRARNTQPR